MITVQGQADLLEIVRALGAPAASRTFCTAGSNIPTKRPMMAMTTSNSINVKPRR